MRHRSTSRFWFARPAGSCLILLTALCAACFAADTSATKAAARQAEATTVKAKILLSRLSMGADEVASSKIRTLLAELFSLARFDAAPAAEEPAALLGVADDTRKASTLQSSHLFQRPPPFPVIA